MQQRIPESELIINPDGSIYHLNLKPGQIANDIITVGDPDRVDKVAKHFDKIEVEVSKREFKTVTGTLGDKRITVISTGIGTDNIDIVLTELDALVNIDFATRLKKPTHTSLNLYRIGTSGSLTAAVDIDTILISRMAVGLDGLMHYYNHPATISEEQLNQKVTDALTELPKIAPYSTTASPQLADMFAHLGTSGITVTATGFYGPQGRQVRGVPTARYFLDNLAEVSHDDLSITNLEMETAGIYGMCSMLGHRAASINAILANRVHGTFSKRPKELVATLIQDVLDILRNS